jgi:hypothetical protein
VPKETILHGWGIGVGVAEDGDQALLQLQDPMTGEQIKMLLDQDAAQTIGKALLAPRVAQPPQSRLQLPR